MLDTYVLFCFFFMLLAILENVVTPLYLVDEITADGVMSDKWLVVTYLVTPQPSTPNPQP